MGTALTLMDVVLSIISVASYITSTYGIGGQVGHTRYRVHIWMQMQSTAQQAHRLAVAITEHSRHKGLCQWGNRGLQQPNGVQEQRHMQSHPAPL
jgi:hypothetical protein